ncbi:MAG TPA: dephospho-CoA kinase [Ferruginibacter sp.]|nr:dephospho-CoA kinase [Ferruginibacter sp.]HRE63937.1 dephospho-CoA kinase [Ferruginibacter sp.]
MTLKVGLTGGIGSGKSTIAKIFETLGIPVYYADDRAKALMNEKEDLKKNIILHFGEDVYLNGILNRSYLSSQVFNNKEKLDLLNALVHPVTITDGDEWMNEQTAPYAIKEAALIFEAGVHKHLDYVIGVTAHAPLRIARVMQRDHITEEKVRERMNKQMDEEEKIKKCHFVIQNNEEQLLIPQVLALHEQLLAIAKK